MGKKLATGGFGTVYRADLEIQGSDMLEPIIVKKVQPPANCYMHNWQLPSAWACANLLGEA